VASVRIIIPCYNEEKRLVTEPFRRFNSTAHDVRFLFVNDGSTDKTGTILQNLIASDPGKFTLLNLSCNSGKAEAVRQGILKAIEFSPEYVGFWDADLATPLEEIPKFLDIAESRPEIQMIMGSRVKLLGRQIIRRNTRHYLGRIFATAVSMVLRLPVYDTQCGAKIFKISGPTKALFEQPFISRWIFDVEIIARLISTRRGKPLAQPDAVIYELPLTEWRDVPGSKLKFTDFFSAAWELTRIRNTYF
jgi:glycosyltransferase involved in cell wall biosynthesis